MVDVGVACRNVTACCVEEVATDELAVDALLDVVAVIGGDAEILVQRALQATFVGSDLAARCSEDIHLAVPEAGELQLHRECLEGRVALALRAQVLEGEGDSSGRVDYLQGVGAFVLTVDLDQDVVLLLLALLREALGAEVAGEGRITLVELGVLARDGGRVVAVLVLGLEAVVDGGDLRICLEEVVDRAPLLLIRRNAGQDTPARAFIIKYLV